MAKEPNNIRLSNEQVKKFAYEIYDRLMVDIGKRKTIVNCVSSNDTHNKKTNMKKGA